MKIRLASALLQKFPGINVAVVTLKNIANTRKSSMVAQLLRGVCAEKKREFQNEAKKKVLEDLLKPTLSEGSVLAETFLLESLLKKVSKGTEIKNENNALDLAHYLGLKYILPLQGRDLDEVEKDLEIDFIVPLKGKKAADIEITAQTTNLVLWFVDIGNYSKEEFSALPLELVKVIQKYCFGDAEIFLLNQNTTEVDLSYISRKEEFYQVRMAREAAKNPPPPSVETTTLPESPFPPAPLMKDQLRDELSKAVSGLTTTLDIISPLFNEAVHLETPKEKAHGDYATSVALKLGKALSKNPREIAEAILKNLPSLPYLERTEIAGAGFINFYLSQSYFAEELQKILKTKQFYGRLKKGEGQKVLVEYSAPNIAKPLGAHHLLSTIIGQTLANLLRFGGYEVVSLNYLGDWGTQFGKLIYAYRTWGNQEQVLQDPLNELLKLYVRFHDEAEKEPSLEDKGREEFKKLEEGDEENKKLWQWIREISIKDLEKNYQKLGIHFDEYLGESLYEQSMKDVLEEGKNKNIFVPGEKGALIVQFENDQYPPYLIQKADGATLYSTRDLASIKDRLSRYHPSRLLYVVDVAQSLHFQQLFATAKKLGYDGAEFVHVSFGRMQFADEKMSTRKGNIILVDELVNEAIARARIVINQKSQQLSEEEKNYLAENVAIGAIKYHLVSQNRETNLLFDWDRMLSLEGNSAPYLQYTYARARSILRKMQEQQDSANEHSAQTDIFSIEEAQRAASDQDKKSFEQPFEQELLHHLAKFSDSIDQAIQTYKPNLLTNYLYELAQIFNSFYQEVPVLTAGNEDLLKSRLQLVEAVSQVIHNGLGILGIAVFEKM